ATPFFGSHRRGIHRAPLLAWPVLGPAVHEAQIEVAISSRLTASLPLRFALQFLRFCARLRAVRLGRRPGRSVKRPGRGPNKGGFAAGRRSSVSRLPGGCLDAPLDHRVTAPLKSWVHPPPRGPAAVLSRGSTRRRGARPTYATLVEPRG